MGFKLYLLSLSGMLCQLICEVCIVRMMLLILQELLSIEVSLTIFLLCDFILLNRCRTCLSICQKYSYTNNNYNSKLALYGQTQINLISKYIHFLCPNFQTLTNHSIRIFKHFLIFSRPILFCVLLSNQHI